MEDNTEHKQLTQQKLLEPFDNTLGDHIERLLGTRYGIEALPLNISTVSCLILIAARETEIESFPYLPPERYTNEKLINALEEISLETGDDLEVQLLDMIEKNYIKVADDGRYFANKSTKSMSQLFDRIFPQMPGLNLVAYLGQMMDEVQMGRKEMDMAIDQFNQMLTMQGIPLKKGEVEKAHAESQDGHPLETGPLQGQSPLSKEKPSSVISKPRTLTSQLETRVLETPSPNDEMAPFGELEPDKPAADKAEQVETIKGPPVQGFGDEPQTGEIPSKDISEKSPDFLDPSPESSVEKKDERTDGLESIEVHEDKTEPKSIDAERKMDNVDQPAELDDDDIEKKITAFEQELGLKCPLCRVGGIRPEKTTKGKLYYRCAQKECGFISWGKPYYLTCPQCKNPFLVETANGAGEAILKCPRATCHYWQHFPWDEDETEESSDAPKIRTKRVVRRRPRRRVRRVVRRKS